MANDNKPNAWQAMAKAAMAQSLQLQAKTKEVQMALDRIRDLSRAEMILEQAVQRFWTAQDWTGIDGWKIISAYQYLDHDMAYIRGQKDYWLS